jgi:hypothetical protein
VIFLKRVKIIFVKEIKQFVVTWSPDTLRRVVIQRLEQGDNSLPVVTLWSPGCHPKKEFSENLILGGKYAYEISR